MGGAGWGRSKVWCNPYLQQRQAKCMGGATHHACCVFRILPLQIALSCLLAWLQMTAW